MRFAILAGAIVAGIALVGAAWLVLADPGGIEPAAPAMSPPVAGVPQDPCPAPGAPAPAGAIATQPVAAEQDQVSGPGRIQGRLVDPEGRPVTGGAIMARSHVRRGGGWHAVSIAAKSDGAGRFLIGNLPPGSWILDAEDGVRSLARPEKHDLPPGSPELTITLRLAAGATIEGTVGDPQAKPIPGVRVAVTAAGAKKKGGLVDPIASRECVTDASGRYRCAGLRSGCRFTFAPEHPEYFAREEAEPVTVEGDAVRDLVLVPFATLGGRVEGPEGDPIAGAEVEIVGLDPVESGTDGNFTIPRLRADGGPKEILAATPDLDLAGRCTVNLQPGEVRDDVVVRITRTARIRGRVTDILGEGTGGAAVTATMVSAAELADAGVHRNLSYAGGTSGSGIRVSEAFGDHVLRRHAIQALNESLGRRLDLFVAGGDVSWKVNFAGAQAVSAEATMSAPPEVRPRVTLASADPPEEASEAAQILDVSDQGPIVGAVTERNVLSSSYTVNYDSGSWQFRNTPRLVISSEWLAGSVVFAGVAPRLPLHERLDGPFPAVADANGDYVVLGLPPGTFRIAASAESFIAGGPELPIVLAAAGEEARADIVLHRGAVIRGAFSGGGDQPPDSVEIMISERGPDAVSNHTVKWAPEFEITSLPAGVFDLRARLGKNSEWVAEADGLVLELDGVVSGILLEFAPGAEVRGLVKDPSGAPVSGAAITMDVPGGQSQAKSDEHGAWRIGGLFSGGARIQAQAEGFLESNPEPIELPARARVLHEITLHRGHVLDGQVRDADGRDAVNAMIVLRSGHRTLSGRTGEDGRFRIENVPPDAWRVYCRTDDYRRNARIPLVVERDRAPPPLEIRLAEGLVARGRVVDDTGAARADVTVLATAADNDTLHRKGQSGPDGSFEIRNLYEGAYTLSVEGGECTAALFEVHPGRPVPVLTVIVR